MDILSATIIAMGFAVGMSVQAYFLYRLVSLISILRAAPDVQSFNWMSKKIGKKPEEKEKKEPKDISPDELNEEALKNIRRQIGFSSKK